MTMPQTRHYEMKDSGVEWIGKMPSHWNTLRLQKIYRIKKDIAGTAGYTVLSVTQHGIKPKNMDSKGQFALDYSKYQLVKSGDFVMNHMDLLTGWVDISKYDGVTSPDYRVFTSIANCQNTFFKYIFQFCYMNRVFYGLGQGVADVGRWRLPADMFRKFMLPVPPLSEQTAIAAYLDEKCATIDAIIAEAKASIEEYKSWKASVIFETVTKGLNPNAEMKDSGVEWIGEIPGGWAVERLKAMFSFGKGLPITKEDLVEQGIPVISYGQIHAKFNTGVEVLPQLLRYVDAKWLESNANSLVSEGDFIFADTSEDMEGCGNCVYVDTLNEGAQLFAGYHTITFKPKRSKHNKFLAYLFKSDAWRTQLRSRVGGVKLFSISRRMLNLATVILPPQNEQTAIVAYLDSKCAAIDGIILEKEELIRELENYKRSLIFEAVTGKRRVC